MGKVTSLLGAGPDGRKVIDDATWACLVELIPLCDQARSELVMLVLTEQGAEETEWWWRQNGPEPPHKSLKDLIRAAALVRELSRSLAGLGAGARSAIPADRPIISLLDGVGPLDGDFIALANLQQRLDAAVEEASAWKGARGGNPGLRRLVEGINGVVIRYTGKRLVGSSGNPKRGSSPGRKSLDFVDIVVRLVLGPVPTATIVAALKDVIATAP